MAREAGAGKGVGWGVRAGRKKVRMQRRKRENTQAKIWMVQTDGEKCE